MPEKPIPTEPLGTVNQAFNLTKEQVFNNLALMTGWLKWGQRYCTGIINEVIGTETFAGEIQPFKTSNYFGNDQLIQPFDKKYFLINKPDYSYEKGDHILLKIDDKGEITPLGWFKNPKGLEWPVMVGRVTDTLVQRIVFSMTVTCVPHYWTAEKYSNWRLSFYDEDRVFLREISLSGGGGFTQIGGTPGASDDWITYTGVPGTGLSPFSSSCYKCPCAYEGNAGLSYDTDFVISFMDHVQTISGTLKAFNNLNVTGSDGPRPIDFLTVEEAGYQMEIYKQGFWVINPDKTEVYTEPELIKTTRYAYEWNLTPIRDEAVGTLNFLGRPTPDGDFIVMETIKIPMDGASGRYYR